MNASCRSCNAPLSHSFVDLGSMPLANDYPQSAETELPAYPLHVMVCDRCFLVQIHHSVTPQAIFSDYAYFSSYSSTWLAHSHAFAERMIKELSLGAESCVIEIASNDGYLLRNFVAKNIPCLGIEPAANVAAVAIAAGVPTEIAFLTQDTAKRLTSSGQKADLLIANNVIAHVPDLNDFIASLALLLKPEGVLSIEFPHLLTLIKTNAFDTIYHEHYSYFSLLALEEALQRHGLRVYAAEKLPTHGGSLRVLACHQNSAQPPIDSDLKQIHTDEQKARFHFPDAYNGFASSVEKVCQQLRDFLTQEIAKGHVIAAYGAAAKGNTLLNVCKITSQQISFVVDRNPAKQGRFLPGSRIPIYAPEKILTENPDILLILPWNIADEVRGQMKGIQAWGGKFVTAIPELRVWDQ